MKSFIDWFRFTALAGDPQLAKRLSVKVRRSIPTSHQDPEAIRFGGESLPTGNERLHFAFVGTTGSGKTTSMQLLMQQSLPSIGKGLGRRALIYDAKRDILSSLSSINRDADTILLNAFDRRTAGWDLSADVQDPSTSQQIATIFIPYNEHLAQPFFEDTARSLVAGVMDSFASLTRRFGVKWNLRDVILGCSPRFASRVLAKCEQNRDIIHSLFRGREDTMKDVMATLSTKLSPFRSIAALWHRAKRTVSLKEWSEREGILVLGSHPAKSEAINAINRVIFSRIVDLVSDYEDCRNHHADPRRTWVFTDELGQLGRLSKLQDFLAFGRSKGVCVVFGFQDIPRLYSIYGKEITHSLLGNISHKAFFRLECDITSAWASSLFGKKQVFIETNSTTASHNPTGASGSTGTSQGFHEIAEVMPSEFMGIEPASAVAGIGGYYIFPAAWKPFQENPFTTGILMPPDPHVANFEPADPADEYLKDWDEEDLRRLHLDRDGSGERRAGAHTKTRTKKEGKGGRLPSD